MDHPFSRRGDVVPSPPTPKRKEQYIPKFQPRAVMRRGVGETLPAKFAATSAKAKGLRFELKAKQLIQKSLPDAQFGIWWSYLETTKSRDCQTDAVLLYPEWSEKPKVVTVFEIKDQHSIDAWYQLRKLYQPVLSDYYRVPINVVEVCRVFDPAVVFPEPVVRIDNLGDWVSGIHPEFGVYRCPR